MQEFNLWLTTLIVLFGWWTFIFVNVCRVNSSSNIFMSIPLKLLTLLLEMIISAPSLFPRPPPSAQIPTYCRTSNSPPCKSKSPSTYYVPSTGKVKLVLIFGIFGHIWHRRCSISHSSLEFKGMEICRTVKEVALHVSLSFLHPLRGKLDSLLTDKLSN